MDRHPPDTPPVLPFAPRAEDQIRFILELDQNKESAGYVDIFG